MALIEFSPLGLYCPQGNFYIDPSQGVDKAVITHAHSDHARGGSRQYLCHTHTRPLLALRLGKNNYQTLEWNEAITLNGVRLSLHPAGHVIGSSQVRLEYKGETWVVSGDYKTTDDGISGAFEPVKCQHFVTESTFALPVYRWQRDEDLFSEMGNWITQNRALGKTSVLQAYSLGKAQRVIKNLAPYVRQVFASQAVYDTQQVLKQAGFSFPEVRLLRPGLAKEEYQHSLVVAPGPGAGQEWQELLPAASGVCSGWMRVRSRRRGSASEAGFALSDHSDWEGLLQAVAATGAEQVYVTHGFQAEFSRYLNEMGIPAREVRSVYGSPEEYDPENDPGIESRE